MGLLRYSHDSGVAARRVALACRLARLSLRPGGAGLVREILRARAGVGFDLEYYLESNPDVCRGRLHPAEHFVLYGRAEGRRPVRPAPALGATTPDGLAEPGADGETPAPAIEIEEAVTAYARGLATAHGKAFSVVMPTRNRAATIGRAIDSVVAQSYGRWELIVVDDGSTDGTAAMLRERYAALIDAGRLRLVEGPHRGVSAARNAGLREARGDWIAYLDSDNAWREHYLMLTAAGFVASPERRTAYAGIEVHDTVNGRRFQRARVFDWSVLSERNYIDLNVFAHDRLVYEQLGGFDESLRRLVDWDLIVRYTRLYPPKFTNAILADYHLEAALGNISLTEPLQENYAKAAVKSLPDRLAAGVEPLRLAYVLWDWPALSQTFVLAEVEAVRAMGVDVRVYYAGDPDRAAERPPDVPARRVSGLGDLVRALEADSRNWIHSHFVYPAVTTLAWPAAERLGIPFSFMPHAVDIFHHKNRQRNRLAEIGASALCRRVLVYGSHHAGFLVEQGVPAGKIARTPQAVDLSGLRREDAAVAGRDPSEPLRVACVARLIEKKGIADLIDAAGALGPGAVSVRVYGYGPLEDELRARAGAAGAAVSFEGTFEGTEALAAALDAADVLCVPCCEAANGDVDGMPTVFFEAMSRRVPVIAGAVSAIPDFVRDGINGYLTPPRDPAALAGVLDRVRRAEPGELAVVADRAGAWADRALGPDRTARTLLDGIDREPIDVFMVTYCRDGHGSVERTRRAVGSVLAHTTTPFTLTIVDNGSEPGFVEALREMARGEGRIRLIELRENAWCGPASNLALSLARSEFVFYVCSNEGLIVRPGWERAAIGVMRDNPRVGLAGQVVSSPAFPDGAGYLRQEWAPKLRGLDFVRGRPDRAFGHVQGGMWCLRREAYVRDGGFSDALPQARMDIEYSLHLESRGWELADVPGFVSVSTKTLPGLGALLDEHAAALHPVLDGQVGLASFIGAGRGRYCNLCGRRDGVDAPHGFDCPSCGSGPFDRFAYRWIARSPLAYRGLAMSGTGVGPGLLKALGRAFVRVGDGEPADLRLCGSGGVSLAGVRPGGVVLAELKGGRVPEGAALLDAGPASGMLGFGARRFVAMRVVGDAAEAVGAAHPAGGVRRPGAPV